MGRTFSDVNQHRADPNGFAALCWVRASCSALCWAAFLFHHLEPRHPFELRWLTDEFMTSAEEAVLLTFYRTCRAQDVQDGGEFEIKFSAEFVESIESGNCGLEGDATYETEIGKVEKLPGASKL